MEDRITVKIPDWMLDKKKVGATVIVATIFLLLVTSMISKQEEVKVAKVATPEFVPTEDPKSKAYSDTFMMMSGLVAQQSEDFDIKAMEAKNTPGHPCQLMSKEFCLRTFQETREKEIAAISVSQSIPSAERVREIQTRVWEIAVIEAMVTSSNVNKEDSDFAFLKWLSPFQGVSVLPTLNYLGSVSSYRNQRQVGEKQNLEDLRNNLECADNNECL